MNIVGASGSAILVTGSSIAKFEIQFPDWSINDQKNFYKYSIASKLQTSYYGQKYIRSGYTSGSIAGSGYAGLITAPNGYAYAIPGTATGSFKFSTTGSSESFTYIITSSIGTSNPTTQKFAGAALAPNGCIYMVPYGNFANEDYTKVAKIDTNTDKISVIGNIPASVPYYQGGNFAGAVLAPNGNIYGIPARAQYVLKINPNTDTISSFGYVYSNGFENQPNYLGGVLAPNGVIYCVPYFSSLILKIDTNTDTLSYIYTGLNQGRKWNGGVLAPNNNCIYFVPSEATSSLKINPTNDQITIINSSGVAPLGNGGAQVGPDGMIYSINNGSLNYAGHSSRVVINPFTDVMTTVNTAFGTYPTLGFNGVIYAVGTNTLFKLENVNQSFDLDPNFVLSRYKNKY